MSGIQRWLDSIPVPVPRQSGTGAADTLAINVRTFEDLPEGRILAIENRVCSGEWNRLVVIIGGERGEQGAVAVAEGHGQLVRGRHIGGLV